MKIFIIVNRYVGDFEGGAQLQCYLISKYLAQRGHKVFHVVLENAKNKSRLEQVHGFTLIRLNSKKEFKEVLKEHKPEICYIRVFEYLTYLVGEIKKYKNIKVTFSVSHIGEAVRFPRKIWKSFNPKKFLNSIIYNLWNLYNFYGLYRVDKIITLTNEISKSLKKSGLKNIIIRNIAETPEICGDKFKKLSVIWVANLKAPKQPEKYIFLARELKDMDVDFLMIGNIQDKSYERIVKEAQEELPNFHYLGPKSIEETTKLIAKSTILVHTCLPEGFPNNFLQAWARGVPTITLNFDPDGLIESQKIGFYSRTLDKFKKDVRALLENENLIKDMGEKARQYSNKNHNLQESAFAFEKVFNSLLEEK